MNAEEISATISRRGDQLEDAISRIKERQDDVQDDILELQRRKRDGESFNLNHLKKLKTARDGANNQISLLALTRTELFDELPIIRMATGKIKVIAAELDKDARLLKLAETRIKKATKLLEKTEKFLLKLIKLAGVL